MEPHGSRTGAMGSLMSLWIKTFNIRTFYRFSRLPLSLYVFCGRRILLPLLTFQANVTIVNELYPAECIMFRFLIDASQSHYQVEGYKEALAAEHSVSSKAPSSVGSLPLKPDKGAFVKPPQTPSRTEESITEPPASKELVLSGVSSTDHEEVAAATISREGPKDALDEAIEEAKAVKHLVSCLRSSDVPY